MLFLQLKALCCWQHFEDLAMPLYWQSQNVPIKDFLNFFFKSEHCFVAFSLWINAFLTPYQATAWSRKSLLLWKRRHKVHYRQTLCLFFSVLVGNTIVIMIIWSCAFFAAQLNNCAADLTCEWNPCFMIIYRNVKCTDNNSAAHDHDTAAAKKQ